MFIPEAELETDPDLDDAAETSQQLHALASMLGISGEFQQAANLLDRINQGLAAKVKALPQAFHERVLPEGSLSDAQVGRGSSRMLHPPVCASSACNSV